MQLISYPSEAMVEFREKAGEVLRGPLTACTIEILQTNLGYKCNMSCRHCHVAGSPGKNNQMDIRVIRDVLSVLRENRIPVLDITGGAPELNPHFRFLAVEAKKQNIHVIVRTNLTIFFEEGMGDLPEFFSEHSLEVIASLPYYLEGNVDRVRGKETFQMSIRALEKLNSLGYGDGLSGKRLSLVYNPAGAFLPPPQCSLETEYREQLKSRFGISFGKLYAFANMPLGRFREFLVRTNSVEKYIGKLSSSFNPQTLDGLMCRRLISVGWNGMLYDCDFNQSASLNINGDCPQHIKNFNYDRLAHRKIMTADHCYGCTAGQGST
jgi:radical SAM/Cys-rich protein